MAHEMHANRIDAFAAAPGPQQVWPITMFAVAGLAFLAGAAGAMFLPAQSWSWDAPASVACILLALLSAGVGLMAFMIAKSRDRQADALAAQIADDRAYIRDLAQEAEHTLQERTKAQTQPDLSQAPPTHPARTSEF